MNVKTLYALIGAAIVALIAAVIVNQPKKPVSESAEQTKMLLPDFRAHVNEVNTITLTGAEDKVLTTLKRGENGWSIVEKSNYPADLAKVREFLLKLADASVLEQKTSNPKRYPDLGVDDVKDKDAKGILVALDGPKPPVHLIVGNFNGAGGGGTFVRREGEAESLLVKGNITPEKSTANWEQHDLIDIPAARIKQVTLTSPEGKTLRIYKEQPIDSNFKIADVPKGREPSSDFVANTLGAALAGLKSDDVAAAKDQPPGDKVYKANYAAFDGVVVDATAWEKDGKSYVQFAARFDSTLADTQIKFDQAKTKAEYEAHVEDAAKVKSDSKDAKAGVPEMAKPLAVSDPAKDREDRIAATNKEIEALNKTFNGWTFVLPSYKFSSFNKTMDEMLKPLDQKKPDAKGTMPPPKPLIPPPAMKPTGK